MENPLTENLRRLQMDGFCILEDIIPADQVGAVKEDVVQTQATQHQEAEGEMAKTRSRGHRIGARGVANLKQVINATQSFVPYLADRRILDTVEAVFGPHARISSTSCVINHPGNERGYLHADWPYNATNASHVPAPYPDATLHLSSIWMLSPFSAATGGTIILPGSHRKLDNPASGTMSAIDRDTPYPGEMHVSGAAGSVLLYDSRLWHAVASNHSDQPRVAIIIRYAPWWLNLNPTMVGTPEHTSMVVETGGKNYDAPPVRADVYKNLPQDVKPLFRHWVE
jgi:ectoine hydroxylase-related dioxygenase (phytanoyl-CoA dioxygenase family)